MTYTPYTGEPCGCRPGIERDNCPRCEGSGWRIDFAAIHAARDAARDTAPECPVCSGPGVLLGGLGNLTHYRCRDCGTGWHTGWNGKVSTEDDD